MPKKSPQRKPKTTAAAQRRVRATRPQKKSARATEKPKCRHCGGGPQTFRFLHRLYKFDIDRAREIVLDGRQALELEPDDVKFSVEGCRIYAEHLDHVDTRYPGIIAHYWYPMPDGTVAQGHVLIDGNHRAARCLRDGLPYYVHILTEDESREVTLRAPDVESILASVRPAKRRSSRRRTSPRRPRRRTRQVV